MGKRVRENQKLFHEIGMGEMVGPIDGKGGRKYHYTILWFQRGFSRVSLRRTGFMNKETRHQLEWSAKNGGKCSAHFTFKEFKSKGNGHICIHRKLVRALERLRRHINRPIGIMSGFRDYHYNKYVVKSVENSQHVFGKAVDPMQRDIPLATVQSLEIFSGLGYRTINGKKIWAHGDVRGGKTNFTRGTVKNPTIWSYD